jgi:DNA (cytosine-5)-methyltransferase 1
MSDLTRTPAPAGGWNVLELFAGIGGIGLGLERAGMTVVGQVELNPFSRSVLARHWPEVPRHDDVRTCIGWWRSRPRPAVHVVAGGFPCQPFSSAGRRRGTADERWGWPWMADVVRALRPRYVLVENVGAVLDDAEAFGWILGDLASFGFDADWGVFPACAVGAPHTRDRLFLVAHSHRLDGQARLGAGAGRPVPTRHRDASAWPDPVDGLMEAARRSRRVADGIPDQLEPARVTALGNAVVPQVAEYIGRHITGIPAAARDGD